MASERVPMSEETFLALAAMLGLDSSDGHLEVLYPEVATLLERAESVHEIDASSIPVEHAAASFDGGAA
jgi:hypothetical protein